MTPEHASKSYGTEGSDWRRVGASIELVPLLWNIRSCDCLLWVIMRTCAGLNVTTEQCIWHTAQACSGGPALGSLVCVTIVGSLARSLVLQKLSNQGSFFFLFRNIICLYGRHYFSKALTSKQQLEPSTKTKADKQNALLFWHANLLGKETEIHSVL